MDPRRYEEIERMQRMIPFLVETRLSKIIRVAKSGAYQEKRKQMTNEERWLCEEIAESTLCLARKSNGIDAMKYRSLNTTPMDLTMRAEQMLGRIPLSCNNFEAQSDVRA